MRVACSTKLFAETSLSIEYHKGIQNQPQPQPRGVRALRERRGHPIHPPWRGDHSRGLGRTSRGRTSARSCYEMILGGRTLPELHVSAFIAVSQCCEVVCKRKKKASTHVKMTSSTRSPTSTTPTATPSPRWLSTAARRRALPPHRAHHMPGFPWLPLPCLSHPCAVPRLETVTVSV